MAIQVSSDRQFRRTHSQLTLPHESIIFIIDQLIDFIPMMDPFPHKLINEYHEQRTNGTLRYPAHYLEWIFSLGNLGVHVRWKIIDMLKDNIIMSQLHPLIPRNFNWFKFIYNLKELAPNWESLSHNQWALLFINYAADEGAPWLRVLEPIYREGWQLYYFTILNPDHILVKVQRGLIELSPETFEQAAKAPLEDHPRAIKTICQTIGLSSNDQALRIFKPNWDPKTNSYFPPNSIQRRPRFGGWSKYELLRAISKIGQVKFDVIQAASPLHPGYKIALDPNGLYTAPSRGQVCSRYPQSIGMELDKINQKLSGFGHYPSMPMYYYETLYRALFHTPRYFNFPLIAEQDLISLTLLRFIAIYDFSLSPLLIDSIEDPKEIVDLIMRRPTFRIEPETQSEMKEIREPLIYQPTGLRARQLASRYGPEKLSGEIEGYNVYQQDLYRQMLKVCQQSEQGQQSRQKLLYYIRSLGLETFILRQTGVDNINLVSTGQLCSIMKRYLTMISSSIYQNIGV